MDKKEPIPKAGTGSIFLDSHFNCEQQALRYLSLREHNRAELRQKLLAKGYSEDLVKTVLDSLASSDALSEVRYVHSFVRSSNKRHPEGKSMLLARLCAKGADRTVAKEVLDDMYDSDYTLALVTSAYNNIVHKRGGTDLKSYEIKAKLFKLGFTQSDLNLFLE